MNALVNTTYYPAILLRKRWIEAHAGEAGTFDLDGELDRITAGPSLPSSEVSALERWAALHENMWHSECHSEPAAGPPPAPPSALPSPDAPTPRSSRRAHRRTPKALVRTSSLSRRTPAERTLPRPSAASATR